MCRCFSCISFSYPSVLFSFYFYCRLSFCFSCTVFRFDCKFRCIPIRLTNSDLTLACNTIHFLFPIFCFVIYLFVFIFGSSFYIFFLLLSNPQYLSGDIVTVSSLKPAILYIVVAAAIVFSLLFHLKLLDSPLISMLKGVLFESITFYLLFVCQI